MRNLVITMYSTFFLLFRYHFVALKFSDDIREDKFFCALPLRTCWLASMQEEEDDI